MKKSRYFQLGFQTKLRYFLLEKAYMRYYIDIINKPLKS